MGIFDKIKRLFSRKSTESTSLSKNKKLNRQKSASTIAEGYSRHAVNLANIRRTLPSSIGKGKLIQPLRVALTGALTGPSVVDLMVLLKKDTCLRRIKNSLISIQI